MEAAQIDQYLKVFRKHWAEGNEKESLKSFADADSILKKVMPSMDEMVDDDNKAALADFYADFCEFLFDYSEMLIHSNKNHMEVIDRLHQMAKKTIKMNPGNFPARFYYVIARSYNVTRPDAGSGPAILKGRDAAETIVGTGFNLLIKALRLGTTAAIAGATRGSFNEAVYQMIETYLAEFQEEPYDAYNYLVHTNMMFIVADYCEDKGYGIYRDIYSAVRTIDTSKMDYSTYDESYWEEKQEMVMEAFILADSKA